MSNFICMECGNALALNADACSCGWRKHAAIKFMQPDYRCAYSLNKQRCKAEGTLSRSCTAKGAWYCSHHWNIN